jgi:antitoxin YafN
MHKILVEKSVSITELRKNPALYLSGEPVAVLSNNRPAGYLMGPEVFEAIMEALQQREQGREIAGSFRPSAAQLRSIAQRGNELLGKASVQDLSEFTL